MSRLSSRSVRNSGAVELNSRSPVDFVDALVRLERHVDLRAGVVEPHGAGFVDERAVEILFADEVENRAR